MWGKTNVLFFMRKVLLTRENPFIKYIEDTCKESGLDLRKSKIKDGNKVSDTTLFLVVFDDINEFMTFFVDTKKSLIQFPSTTSRKFGKSFPQTVKLTMSNINKIIEIFNQWKNIKTYDDRIFEK